MSCDLSYQKLMILVFLFLILWSAKKILDETKGALIHLSRKPVIDLQSSFHVASHTNYCCLAYPPFTNDSSKVTTCRSKMC